MVRPPIPPELPKAPPPLPSLARTNRAAPLLELHESPIGESTPYPPPLPPETRRELDPPPLPIVRRQARNEFKLILAGIEWIFGFACLIGALAILAAIPILQFLSLGYLLEAAGRVARSGRLRDGFIGVRTMARIGGIVVAS